MDKKIDPRDSDATLMDIIRTGRRRTRHIVDRRGPKKQTIKGAPAAGKKIA
jgi:hypothetical protein